MYSSLDLVDSTALRQLRRLQWQKDQTVRASTRNGIDYAASTMGAGVGTLLRRGLVKGGIIKDEEEERAGKITKAQEVAEAAYNDIPEDQRPTDPLAAGIAQRMELLRELQDAGLNDEADTVRSQILTYRKQQMEFEKLQKDMDYTDVRMRGQEIENLIEEETAGDTVLERRARAAEAASSARVAIGTEPLKVRSAQVEFDTKVEKLSQDRSLRPYVEARAKADARIASIQAQYGGAVPELAKLQTERDYWMEYVHDNPGSTLGKQRLDEMNTAIETKITGSQRILTGPYDPTTTQKGLLQADIRNMSTITMEVNNLLTTLGEVGNEQPLGATANVRGAIGGYIAQGLSVVNAPGAIQEGAQNLFMNNDENTVRSQARQLRTSISTWLAAGNMREVHVKAANDLLQALDEPAVTSRDVANAMNNFLVWMTDKQRVAFDVLDNDLSVTRPPGMGASSGNAAADDFTNLLRSPGEGE